MLATVGLLSALLLGPPVVLPFAHGKKGAFSMEFDDSMDSQVKNALPLLAKYRFAATFYINPGRTNYRPEIWEKAVPEASHELGDHTMHHGDTIGAEQGAKEIGDAAKAIERALGHPVLTPFAVPGGVKWEIPEADFQRILKENRLIFPGRGDFYQDSQSDLKRFSRMALEKLGLHPKGAQISGGDIVRFPLLALETGVWRQLGFHGIGGEWLSTSTDRLELLLQFLDLHRNDLWVAPTGTVWKYQREREAVTGVDVVQSGEKTLRITPQFDHTKLDPFELYDVPLTVRVPLPSGWHKVSVSVEGHRQRAQAKDGSVDVDASPQSEAIVLEKG